MITQKRIAALLGTLLIVSSLLAGSREHSYRRSRPRHGCSRGFSDHRCGKSTRTGHHHGDDQPLSGHKRNSCRTSPISS